MIMQPPAPELQCRRCRHWLILDFDDYTFRRYKIRLLIRHCPILKCPNCRYRTSLAKTVGKTSRPAQIATRISKSGFAVVTLRYDVEPGNRFPIFDEQILTRLRGKTKT